MEQADWRGMPYYDVFWRKRHLTSREMRAIYANYYTYVFWSMVVSILVLLDLHGFAEKVSLFGLTVYTISMVAVTVSIYVLVSALGMKISKTHSRFFIFYPVVGLLAMTAATYVVEIGMSAIFGGGISLEYAAEKLPVNLVLNLTLETLYITFVLPVAKLSEEAERKPDAAGEGCKTLMIAGKTFHCAQLVSVSAQDHYVLVRTKTGKELMRARLSDLIGQLNCRRGIQPHRSHWVARESVVNLGSREGQKYLKMVDGNEIPVARGRMVDVQEWLEK